MINESMLKSEVASRSARLAAVTGGSGFIGLNLVHSLLEKGWIVRVLTRDGSKFANWTHPSLEIHKGDMLNIDNVADKFLEGVDVLFNCAAEIHDHTKMAEINIKSTRHLAELSVGKVKHWLQLGSAGVYGIFRGDSVDEGSIPDPKGTYEKTKRESDIILMEMFKQSKLDVCIVHPTTVFGPGMTNQSLRALIRHIKKGHFFYIGDPLSGKYISSYVYVDDVVESIIRIVGSDDSRGKVYIISDDMPFADFIAEIAKNVGAKELSRVVPRWMGYLAGMTGSVIPLMPITMSRVRAMTNTTQYSRALFDREIGKSKWVGVSEGLRRYIKSIDL